MRKYIILMTLLIFAFCGRGEKQVSSPSGEHVHQGQAHEHEGEEPEDHEHKEIEVSPEKQIEWGIQIGEASEIAVSSRINLPGMLTLNQNQTAHISSFAEGKVLSVSADLGHRVGKSQILLTINSPEFAQAQASFLQARAKFILSRKEYERAKMLLEEKAIEQREYQRRESEYEKAMTETGVLGSNLHSFGLDHDQIDKLIEKCESLNPDGYLCEIANPNLNIFSPIRGKVIFRDVIVGEHIEPRKILYTVSDLSTLWALLDAYEKDLAVIDKKSKVTIKSSIYPEKEFEGKIIYISDLIDEKLRTVKIRVEVENRDSLLKPNMYIQGIMEKEVGAEKILAIPEEAVQNLDGEKIVFIQEEENVFAAHHVELGEKIGNRVIITSGLEAGEKIVIKGAFSLKAELTKEAFGQAHVH